MKSPALNVQLVDERNALELLRHEWNVLACEDIRDGFFRTASWYLAWLDHIEHKSQPFVITVRDSDNRLVGLAPLCRMQYHFCGFSFTAIGFGGSSTVCGDYLDILTTGDRSLIVQAVLERLWELRPQWSIFILGDVLKDKDLHSVTKLWAERKGMTARPLYDVPCSYIELPSSLEAYVKGLGKSMRHNIRRKSSEAFGKHGAHVQVYTEPNEVVAHLDDLIRLHEARWGRDGQLGVLSYNGFPNFLRQITISPPPGAQTRLYVLTHEGQPVAANVAFCFGKSLLVYQAGMDPNSSLSYLSPGTVLRARIIEDAISNGLQYCDFLRGGDAHKSHWTKTTRTISALVVVQSLWVRAFFQAAALARWVKHLVVKTKIPYAVGDTVKVQEL